MSGTIFRSVPLDNTSSNITYASNGTTTLAEAWSFQSNVPSNQSLYNNTESLSYQVNAYAILSFYGIAVEYWGNQNKDHGPCDIYLDGIYVTTINSYLATLADPIMLYSASNLSLADHSLRIVVQTIQGSTHRLGCEIDSFLVNQTIPVSADLSSTYSGGDIGVGSNTASSGTALENNGGSKAKSGPSPAVIAGAVLGSVVAICVFALGWWWYSAYRRLRRGDYEGTVISEHRNTPVSTTPYSVSSKHHSPRAGPPVQSLLDEESVYPTHQTSRFDTYGRPSHDAVPRAPSLSPSFSATTTDYSNLRSPPPKYQQ